MYVCMYVCRGHIYIYIYVCFCEYIYIYKFLIHNISFIFLLICYYTPPTYIYTYHNNVCKLQYLLRARLISGIKHI